MNLCNRAKTNKQKQNSTILITCAALTKAMIPGEATLLLPPLAALLSTKQMIRGRHSAMCMLESRLQSHQGHSCPRSGSPKPPTSSPWVHILLPHQLVRMNRAMSHHQRLSILNFLSTAMLYQCKASFQQHTDTPLLLLTMQTLFQTLLSSFLHDHETYMQLFYKILFLCHSTNIIVSPERSWLTMTSPANSQQKYTFLGVFLPHYLRKLSRSFLSQQQILSKLAYSFWVHLLNHLKTIKKYVVWYFIVLRKLSG